MAQYVLRPGTPIEASQYVPGAEDGTNTFTDISVVDNPYPPDLEPIIGFWTVRTGDHWSASIPYVGDVEYILNSDDYIITPISGPKYRMNKADFEAKYMLDDSSSL